MGQNGPDIGITQLASALSINKTTVHRLLSAMQKFELIERNPESERYRLGLRLHELGARAMEYRTLQSEARRFLVELSVRSRESVSLAVPAAGGVVCLDRIDSTHSVITVRTVVGARFPAHCTAAGKAVLAHLPEAEIDAILAINPLKRFTPSTMTRASDLKKNLRQIRECGYALDDQELERGLSGVAVPVLTASGQLIAAVGIAGPTLRFRGKELTQQISLAREIAAKVSASLGEQHARFRTY
jgi:IclR family KDG regulon transcriptional repressor